MQNKIEIKGARVHNLKNIHLKIPRNKLVVFSGVSGSGKSSLAFDTIYAEGQRRYVESLSSYARQFLGIMDKPDVDFIEGLSPAISIEQKSRSNNPRSTVGTITEIHDYLRILFARIGHIHCHTCGKEIGAQSSEEIVNDILTLPIDTKFIISAPILTNRKGEYKELFESFLKSGFVRVRVDGEIMELHEGFKVDKHKKHDIDIIIDRLSMREGIRSRVAESVETALKHGTGRVTVETSEGNKKFYSEHLYCSECGISYNEVTPQTFSFNAPQGMCVDCNGLGVKKEVDPRAIIPNDEISVMDGAVRLWGVLRKKRDTWTYKKVTELFKKFDVDPSVPFRDLPEDFKKMLINGKRSERVEGLVPVIQRRYLETSSPEARIYYEQFMIDKSCPVCGGHRLNKEATHVLVGGRSITELSVMSIAEMNMFFADLTLTEIELQIARELIKEIRNRVTFLLDVGLYYLSLERKAPSLSGGESQRIRLASQIGSGLVGVLYILDEPSIGLHQRDNTSLINSLKNLRDLGNTVIVVEHDRDTIEEADWVVEFGPGAGVCGGAITFEGLPTTMRDSSDCLTGQYLRNEKKISAKPSIRPLDDRWITLSGCKENNLKTITASFPVGVMTLVTGVSGSGKSSLINDTLFPAVSNRLNKTAKQTGEFEGLTGLEYIDKVIEINQDPIGRTPRSNPVTYIGVFDNIRELFALHPESKLRGYTSGRFSFNVKGGRCEACGGNGMKKIEMHFLPDVYVTCDVCKGHRYNTETLEVRFNGKNINEVLEMTVSEAVEFFKDIPSVKKGLQTLYDVGLGYIKLGQQATTLSGGEAQRIKLAKELSRPGTGKTLYILDEPTTGLHFDDVNKLLTVLNRLVDAGNTMIIIEHNLDVIKYADWIIDLGPEGGKDGGFVVFAGNPHDLVKNKKSYTGQYLKKYLKEAK